MLNLTAYIVYLIVWIYGENRLLQILTKMLVTLTTHFLIFTLMWFCIIHFEILVNFELRIWWTILVSINLVLTLIWFILHKVTFYRVFKTNALVIHNFVVPNTSCYLWLLAKNDYSTSIKLYLRGFALIFLIEAL